MSILDQLKSIHRYLAVTVIVLIISIFAGIIPSLILSDWTWFSRSGALLVIFAIYLIWIDYQGQINSDLDNVLDGFDDHLKKTTENEPDRAKIMSEVSSQFDEVRTATKKRFQNIEFYLVMFGTLIWAYGDLIDRFYLTACRT